MRRHRSTRPGAPRHGLQPRRHADRRGPEDRRLAARRRPRHRRHRRRHTRPRSPDQRIPARKRAPGERTGRFRIGGDQPVLDADGRSRISVALWRRWRRRWRRPVSAAAKPRRAGVGRRCTRCRSRRRRPRRRRRPCRSRSRLRRCSGGRTTQNTPWVSLKCPHLTHWSPPTPPWSGNSVRQGSSPPEPL